MSISTFALPDRPSADRWSPPSVAVRRDPSAERRGEICRVGAKLFAAEGVDAVTLGRLATGSGINPTALARLYPSVEAVLGDLLDDFTINLNAEVGAAHDAAHEPGADKAPQRRLEAVVAGFIEAATRHADAYRAFLFCVHRLAEAPRHSPQGPRERHAEARRIAALLIATAIAETTGVWSVLGATAGSHPNRTSLRLGVRSVRGRFCEIVKAAEAGTDISLTRRGRQVARIVGCGNRGIG